MVWMVMKEYQWSKNPLKEHHLSLVSPFTSNRSFILFTCHITLLFTCHIISLTICWFTCWHFVNLLLFFYLLTCCYLVDLPVDMADKTVPPHTLPCLSSDYWLCQIWPGVSFSDVFCSVFLRCISLMYFSGFRFDIKCDLECISPMYFSAKVSDWIPNVTWSVSSASSLTTFSSLNSSWKCSHYNSHHCHRMCCQAPA